MSKDLCANTHLNSPLSLTLLREILHHVRNPEIKNFRSKNVKYKSLQLSNFLELIGESGASLEIQEIQRWIRSIHKAGEISGMRQNSTIHYRHLTKSLLMTVPYHLKKLSLNLTTDQIKEKIIQSFDLGIDNVTGNYYALRCFLEQGVCITAKPTRFSLRVPSEWDEWSILSEGERIIKGQHRMGDHVLEIIMNREFVKISWMGRSLLTNRQHVLLLSDIIAQRFVIRLVHKNASLWGFEHYPSEEDLRKTYEFGDILTEKFGSEAYSVLSSWEAYIVGTVLNSENDILETGEAFFKGVRDGMKGALGEDNINLLENHLTIWADSWIMTKTNHVKFQLFGLYRIWGHPTINEEEGVKKLKSIACRERICNPHVIKMIENKWREYFCMNYYEKNRHWPKIIVPDKAPNRGPIKAIRENSPLNVYEKDYKLEDWRYIKFEKTFNVPEKFELSEMISDKALSHNIEELKESCKRDGGIGAGHKRNVILSWLQTNYNDPASFLDKIDKLGFSDLETVVGLHPKERELKLYARMFGLLTIEKRLYVVLTEAMLAENIFPYFPEITMTYDAVTLQTKIHANTAGLKGDMNNFHRAIINMDFKKWNSFMRREETEGIFRDFDHLFGYTKVFIRTHDMFEHAMMYLADGTITPFDEKGNVIPGECVWFNHLGGIEGLRQKGWTIFTVVILKYISENEGIQCQIMGQGDNQVLIVRYDKRLGIPIKDQHKNFLDHMENFLEKIGPPLKREETWSSSFLFIYGKFPVYKGRPICMSIKKLCRTMRLTNEGFLNLESTLSSITANSSAATGSDYTPIIPYIIGSFESLGAIDLHCQYPFFTEEGYTFDLTSRIKIPVDGVSVSFRHSLTKYDLKAIKSRSTVFLAALLMTPCVLGGYPTLQLCDLMNHGFPDPLSLNIWGLKSLYEELPIENVLRKLITNLMNPVYMPTVNYSMLCEDPVSINIFKPSSGGEKLKRMVFDFLTTQVEVKNEQFLTFLSLAKEKQDSLAELLCTMRPMNPRVANSIMSSTIVGRAMKVVSKVNKTTTLIGLMIGSQRPSEDEDKPYRSVSSRLGQFESNYLLGVINSIFGHRDWKIENIGGVCSTRLAQKLRTESWQMEITGVTVSVPQEMLKMYDTAGRSCEDDEHPNNHLGHIKLMTELTMSEISQYDYDPLNLELGPFKPLFGSSTKNKVQFEGGQLKVSAPPLLKGILDCLCLINWGTENDSNLSRLIKSLFASFTDLDPNLLTPDNKSISGSVEHRWQDMRTSHKSTLSILYELTTHMTALTNYFTPERAEQVDGTDNTNISFQSIFTWIAGQWSTMMINKDRSVSSNKHLHVICERCIMPIYEGYLEINDPQPYISSQDNDKMKINPYCWVSKEKLMAGWKQTSPPIMDIPDNDLTLSQLDDMLIMSTIDKYFSDFPPVVSDRYADFKFRESSEVIPVTVALTLKIPKFIKAVVMHLYLYYIWIYCSSFQSSGVNVIKNMLSLIRMTISHLPSSWFYGMISLLLNNQGMYLLVQENPGITPPRGTPPSREEKAKYFKDLITVISNGMDSQSLLKEIKLGKQSVLRIGKLHILSPFLRICSSHLMRLDNPILHIDLQAMTLMKDILREGGELVFTDSNINYEELLVRSNQGIDPVRRRVWEYGNQIRALKLKGVKATVDKLAKMISETRPRVSNDESDTQNMSDDMVHLPEGSSIMIDLDTEQTRFRRENVKTSLIGTFTRSLIHHYDRLYLVSTSAGYKIAGILNDLINSWRLIYPNDIRGAGFTGDGTGGYTSMGGRFFPRANLYYNTLFEVEKLSSTGLDNYIPAALMVDRSAFRRLKGLSQTIEGISDLTRTEFVDNWVPEGPLNILVCDAEGGGWEKPDKMLKITTNLVKICIKKKTENLLIKSYASNLAALYTQVVIMAAYFRRVMIIRSKFSTVGSTEVFILGVRSRTNHHELIVSCTGDTISIEGQTPTNLIYSEFAAEMMDRTHLFIQENRQVLQVYKELLPNHAWKQGAQDRLKTEIANWLVGKDTHPTLIEMLTMAWRAPFNFQRFKQKGVSPWRSNFLTDKIQRFIARGFLILLSGLINNTDDFKKWEKMIETHYLQVYATMDGSWGFSIFPFGKKVARNCVSTALSHLFEGSKIRELVVEAGIFSDIKSQFNINYGNLTLDHPYKMFADEDPVWWRNIPESTMMVSLTPVRKYFRDPKGDYHIAPLVLNIKVGALDKRDKSRDPWLQDEREMEMGGNLVFVDKGEYLIKRKHIKLQITPQSHGMHVLMKQLGI